MNKKNKTYAPESKERTDVKLFLISDTHFDHENIIKYCNRPFKSKDEMNKAIIENWNAVVGNSDTIYILGDVTFGREHRPIDYWMGELKGNKFLVKGNHDKGRITKANKIANGTILKHAGLEFMLMHNPRRPAKWHGWIIHGDKHNHDMVNFPLVNCKNKTANVCIELTGYSPILLDDLVEKIKQCEQSV